MSDLASDGSPSPLFGSKTPTSSAHTLSQPQASSRMALRNSNIQAKTPLCTTVTKSVGESSPSLPSKNSKNERCDIQRTPHFMTTRNASRNKINSQPTPSPKGILKNMHVYNPSPTSKSITFGGTYYSPSTIFDSRSDNKTFGQGPLHLDAHGESSTFIDEAVKTNKLDKKGQVVESTTKKSSKRSQSVSPGGRVGKQKISGGCSCKEICDPETCFCVQNELCCMVESDGFPCACSEIGCRNEFGRRQYDPLKILSHFQTTIKRVNT